MSKILWLIIRPKEGIKFIFNVNFIEKFFLERMMKKKKIEFLQKNDKLKGEMFDGVIVDEVCE